MGAAEPVPVLAAVTIQERDFVRHTRLVAELSKPLILLSAGADGRITDVLVGPGGLVESGSVLAEVNGVDVVAVHTGRPFWRVLDATSRGEDVSDLRCFLRSLDLLEGSCDDYFDSETGTAVRAFNRRIGREDVSEFDPGYVVWLPVPEVSVGVVLIEKGEWFPGLASPVLAGATEIVAARVETDQLDPEDAEQYGPFVFQVAGTDQEFAVHVDEALAVAVGDLDRLADTLLSADVASHDDPEASTSGISRVSGVLRGARTQESLSIPTVAIVETRDRLCVYTQDAAGFSAVEVTATGSSVSGATFVEGNLSEGSQVVVNPYEVGMTSC